MGRAAARTPVRLLAYCLMPNHWHLVVWPDSDLAVSAYVHWLSGEHARHYNDEHELVGHVYQGRFRSVLVHDPRQFIALLRYVESNALRGGLVERAEDWRWSSLVPSRHIELADPPCPRPPRWLDILAEFATGESTARLVGPGPFRDAKEC